MDTITDYAGNTIEIYENAIEEQLYIFYEKLAPDNIAADRAKLDEFITNSTQQRFNACLMYINKAVFSDKRSLKEYPYTNIPNTPMISNRNSYSISMLNEILKYYIYICALYDKQCSIHGFSYLTGISRSYLNQWSDNSYYGEVSADKIDLLKTLDAACENSLSDILSTGKRNPVAILGLLNHHYGWNMPGVREQEHKRVASVDELPTLGNMHNTTALIEGKEDGT